MANRYNSREYEISSSNETVSQEDIIEFCDYIAEIVIKLLDGKKIFSKESFILDQRFGVSDDSDYVIINALVEYEPQKDEHIVSGINGVSLCESGLYYKPGFDRQLTVTHLFFDNGELSFLQEYYLQSDEDSQTIQVALPGNENSGEPKKTITKKERVLGRAINKYITTVTRGKFEGIIEKVEEIIEQEIDDDGE